MFCLLFGLFLRCFVYGLGLAFHCFVCGVGSFFIVLSIVLARAPSLSKGNVGPLYLKAFPFEWGATVFKGIPLWIVHAFAYCFGLFLSFFCRWCWHVFHGSVDGFAFFYGFVYCVGLFLPGLCIVSTSFPCFCLLFWLGFVICLTTALAGFSWFCQWCCLVLFWTIRQAFMSHKRARTWTMQ